MTRWKSAQPSPTRGSSHKCHEAGSALRQGKMTREADEPRVEEQACAEDSSQRKLSRSRSLRIVWQERHHRGLEPVLAEINNMLLRGECDVSEWVEVQQKDPISAPLNETITDDKPAKQDQNVDLKMSDDFRDWPPASVFGTSIATKDVAQIEQQQQGIKFEADEVISEPKWMPQVVGRIETFLRQGFDKFSELMEDLQARFGGSVCQYEDEIRVMAEKVRRLLEEDESFLEAEAERTRVRAVQGYAAQTVQQLWRRYSFRKALSNCPIRRLRWAVSIIQLWFRCRIARTRTIKMTRKCAALQIQRSFRSWRQCRYEKAISEVRSAGLRRFRERRAAKIVQSRMRTFLRDLNKSRCKAILELMLRKRAKELSCYIMRVVSVQRAWRRSLFSFRVKILAARTIQKAWLKVKQQRNAEAAILLQSAVRSWIAQKRFFRMRSAVISCQSVCRRVTAIRAARRLRSVLSLRQERAHRAQTECRAAIKIQTVFRYLSAKNLLVALRNAKQVGITARLKAEALQAKAVAEAKAKAQAQAQAQAQAEAQAQAKTQAQAKAQAEAQAERNAKPEVQARAMTEAEDRVKKTTNDVKVETTAKAEQKTGSSNSMLSSGRLYGCTGSYLGKQSTVASTIAANAIGAQSLPKLERAPIRRAKLLAPGKPLSSSMSQKASSLGDSSQPEIATHRSQKAQPPKEIFKQAANSNRSALWRHRPAVAADSRDSSASRKSEGINNNDDERENARKKIIQKKGIRAPSQRNSYSWSYSSQLEAMRQARTEADEPSILQKLGRRINIEYGREEDTLRHIRQTHRKPSRGTLPVTTKGRYSRRAQQALPQLSISIKPRK